MKMYKDGKVAEVDKDQWAQFEKAGWSLDHKAAKVAATKEESPTPEPEKVPVEEATPAEDTDAPVVEEQAEEDTPPEPKPKKSAKKAGNKRRTVKGKDK